MRCCSWLLLSAAILLAGSSAFGDPMYAPAATPADVETISALFAESSPLESGRVVESAGESLGAPVFAPTPSAVGDFTRAEAYRSLTGRSDYELPLAQLDVSDGEYRQLSGRPGGDGSDQ